MMRLALVTEKRVLSSDWGLLLVVTVSKSGYRGQESSEKGVCSGGALQCDGSAAYLSCLL